MIGNHVESAVMTENIQTIANELRPSILNAPEKVVLLLTTGIEQVIFILARLFKIKISQFPYRHQTSKSWLKVIINFLKSKFSLVLIKLKLLRKSTNTNLKELLLILFQVRKKISSRWAKLLHKLSYQPDVE